MLFLLLALVAIAVGFDLLTRSRLQATTDLQCQGEYADTMQVQSLRTRETEQGPRSQYSYLVRSSAQYECPFFGPDGKLRRKRVSATELGTAFAYEVAGNETYLLTNDHVASWPEVTDPLHKLDDVPEGCRRVEEKLRIVRDERDDFEPGQIPLARVAVDPLLDAAILKATQVLNILPYKIGKSAGLRQGNAVRVRGFPLGVMQAVSDGKIVNPYDRDREQGWDHVDFVVDALLSEGNSGSPVMAVSCATRELELVGLYHAGYKGHSALNVVVGIDQLEEFMQKKKRIPRAVAADSVSGLSAKERQRLFAYLGQGGLPLFDFGGVMVRLEARGDILVYHLYGRQFPLDDRRALVIEDLPKANAFGEVGPLFVPVSPQGGPPAAKATASTQPTGTAAGTWHAWPPSSLGTDERDLIARAVDSLRVEALRVFDYRKTLANPGSTEERRRGRDLARAISRDQLLAREMAGTLLDTTERLAIAPTGAHSEQPPTPSPLPALSAPVSTVAPAAATVAPKSAPVPVDDEAN